VNFTETKLRGVFIVDIEPRKDERGFFARTCCRDDFERQGLVGEFRQCSISFNERAGTLRGMHFQEAPYAESKLVRCTAGEIFDVALDLRRDSPTFLQWEAVILSADNHRQLYIPEGVAHGFQTMKHASEVFYQISTPYAPDYSRGYRWDDPAFSIQWPAGPRSISDRDRAFPDFTR
jgi:dTDP-4-dehydrorhamnose 3,5-epimerase